MYYNQGATIPATIQYINSRVIYIKKSNNNNIVPRRISSCFNSLSKLIKQL